MKISRIVTVSQHFSKVLKRFCIRQINAMLEYRLRFLPRLSPDPKRGEQSRSMVNEVLVDRTVGAPSDLALLHPSGETRSGSSSSGYVYAGVSKAETVITCHPGQAYRSARNVRPDHQGCQSATHEHSS